MVKIVQKQLRVLEEENSALKERIDRIYTQLKDFHYAINTLMSISFSELKTVYDTVLSLACNFVDAQRGFLMLLPDEVSSEMKVCAVKNLSPQLIDRGTFDKNMGLIGQVVNKKKVIFIEDSESKVDFRSEKLAEYVGRSFILVPLIHEDEVMGVLAITDKAKGTPFSEDDLKFLTAFSGTAASAINNARFFRELTEKERLEKEMEIARRIQTSLLPAVPKINGLDIAAIMRPAEEVGGDFYDFVLSKDDRYWLAIGDVSSHGVTPGLIMMMSESIFSTLIIHSSYSTPRDVVVGLNTILYENIRQRLKDDDHMTLSVLVYEGEGKFIFAGAHEEIMIYHQATGDCERIGTPGLWVGIVSDISDKTVNSELNLHSGDVLLLYTDGLVEAKNAEGEQFDVERLKETLKKNTHRPAEQIKEEILKEVASWMAEQKDDITLVVIKKLNE